jgi:hypothetical protein
MSLIKVEESGAAECEGAVYLPSFRGGPSDLPAHRGGLSEQEGAYLPASRIQRASQSFDECSSYEGDRPLSVSSPLMRVPTAIDEGFRQLLLRITLAIVEGFVCH